MAGYKNFEGSICKVTVKENNNFIILDPDQCPITDSTLQGYVLKEIEHWELGKTPGSFDFIFTIENRNDPAVPFIRHDHQFARMQSNLHIEKRNIKLIFTEYCQLYENFHKCSVCGLIYKTQLKGLWKRNRFKAPGQG